ncbi:hypothetical protein [Poseidonibacter antarcticus]|uniref:hypothetical protein n=1 Tax=Poseidonibacter antarcticus TaxID=2478538 RepID=UPI000EF47B46|nr:hypothetical protein [Poseidonibacter antarcticus]
MNYKNIIKSIASTSLILLLSGCTLNQTSENQMDKKVELEKKNIIKKLEKVKYKRPAVSFLLKNRIRGILNAMSNNDIFKLNEEYIHPDFGFFNLYKTDGSKVFLEQKMIYNIIDEHTEELSHIISRVNPSSAKLKIIKKNIKFNCSPNDDAFYGWDADGLYISNKMDISLSQMMKELNSYNIKDYEKAIRIEKTSYKVVLTPELSFYLTEIDKNWYITLIDRITSDCSS